MVPFVGDWTPPGNGTAPASRGQPTPEDPVGNYEGVSLYPRGEALTRPYTQLKLVYGTVPLNGSSPDLEVLRRQALKDLKTAAAALKADAVIEVYCDRHPPPDWQGGGVAQTCTGQAVAFL